MVDKARPATSVGIVTEALPNALVLAYLSGKMRLNRIKVMIGDSVELVLDPYGGRARIVRRLDQRNHTVEQ